MIYLQIIWAALGIACTHVKRSLYIAALKLWWWVSVPYCRLVYGLRGRVGLPLILRGWTKLGMLACIPAERLHDYLGTAYDKAERLDRIRHPEKYLGK